MSRISNLWTATAGEPAGYAPLERNIRTDVVVIGGGYTGLSAALHLAWQGAGVCVLEANTVGHGGSGRNVGLVNAGLWTPPDEVEASLGLDQGSRLNAALAAGPAKVFDLVEKFGIDCEAVRNGTLHCAHAPGGLADLESRLAQQEKRQAPVRLLDAAETAQRTGTPRYHGALLDKRAGTVQPLAYARGLARAAVESGAAIREQSPALDISRQRGAWVVRTPGGTVTAAKLIQCTNAYGTGGARPSGFIAMNYFQIATEPLPAQLRETILPGGEGCWDTALVMSSFRCDSAGRLLIGSVGNLEGWGAPVHRSWAERKLRWLFPSLEGIGIEHAWCGRIAMTGDHMPKVSAIGDDAISIHGYSGRGISPGTVFGACAASWAAGDDDAFPVRIGEPATDTLSGAASLYYETGATLTHMLPIR